MNCDWPNCTNEATEELSFVIKEQKAGSWGNVCDEHSSVTREELINEQAIIQVNAGFAIGGNTAEKIEEISIMTEKL